MWRWATGGACIAIGTGDYSSAILARLPGRVIQSDDSAGLVVSASQDRKFFDNFMLVIGILVAVAVGLYGLSRMVSARTQEANVLQDAAMVTATNDRLAPVAERARVDPDRTITDPRL